MITYFLFILLQLWGQPTFSPQEGDLLFQDSDCGPFCEAIETVTTGYRGARLSHVGMLIDNDGELIVIEAVSDGVILTALDTFLNRALDHDGNPKVIVGRLKEEYRPLISAASEHARSKLGKSYDDIFDITNDAYYCSELVYESYKVANDQIDVFQLFPMTFKDPATNETFEIWESYFQNLNYAIPESQPGLNPGGISRSENIDIIHIYGRPIGMKN